MPQSSVMEAVLNIPSTEDVRYRPDLADGPSVMLFGAARVRGQAIDETLRLRLNDDGQIAEMTVWVRPLPGLVAVAAALAPRVARRRAGRVATFVVAAATKGMLLLARLGDRAAVALLGGRRS